MVHPGRASRYPDDLLLPAMLLGVAMTLVDSPGRDGLVAVARRYAAGGSSLTDLRVDLDTVWFALYQRRLPSRGVRAARAAWDPAATNGMSADEVPASA